jgi:long-chain acyl-CoA synthetase
MQERPWLRHYDEGVPPSIEYPSISVHQMLVDSAHKYPDKPCTIFKDAVLTYLEMDTLTNRLATALIELGVKIGDRVGIFMPNIPQFVIAYFGILKAGGVVVAINPQYKSREIEFQVNDAGIEIILALSTYYQILKQAQPQTCLKTVILTDIKEYLPPVLAFLFGLTKEMITNRKIRLAIGDMWFKDILGKQPISAKPNTRVQPDDTALFQFSGGTTGTSKAAVVMHRNLVANALQMRHWLVNTLDGQETVLMAIPLFHVYGMVCGMLYAIRLGAGMVLIPDPHDIREIIRGIHKYKATVFHGVPNIFNAFNSHPDAVSGKYKINTIKACISGSAPLMRETKDRFELLTGGKLCEGYGLSEAPTATHCNPMLGENRAGSIGLPLPDVDCRIVNLDDGLTILDTGEIGELIIRGPQVMKAYHKLPAETMNVIRDGWLYTGDIARMDTDGYFYLVDRKKVLIKPGGFQVWPREVEEVIAAHPKVKEVCVAGVNDFQGAELVKAWVVLKSDETASAEDIQAHCRKQLVYYKVPSLVEFREGLPRTAVGKLLRRELVREHKEHQSTL